MKKVMTVLGIESSCDDTAASIVRILTRTGQKTTESNERILSAEILSSEIFSQESLHKKYGGIVPEIAARAHVECLEECVSLSLQKANILSKELNLISVTAGPGLIGGLISGVTFAKGLAFALGKPLIGVNHLAGHALSPRLSEFLSSEKSLEYPYLVLIASGGHCQFLEALGPSTFNRIGGTIDDSPGEAFDKVARLLGLGYPGGPVIESRAQHGYSDRFSLPRPLFDKPTCNMSFSGLKTATARKIDESLDGLFGTNRKNFINDISASFEKAVLDIFAKKSKLAMKLFRNKHQNKPHLSFCICGGVASNLKLRKSLKTIANEKDFEFFAPPPRLCTDNGAMIASAGAEKFLENGCVESEIFVRSRWPLDTDALPLIGSGKRGVKG